MYFLKMQSKIVRANWRDSLNWYLREETVHNLAILSGIECDGIWWPYHWTSVLKKYPRITQFSRHLCSNKPDNVNWDFPRLPTKRGILLKCLVKLHKLWNFRLHLWKFMNITSCFVVIFATNSSSFVCYCSISSKKIFWI